MSNSHYNEFKIINKIHYNKFKFVRVIPKGKKYFVWFQSRIGDDSTKIKFFECINNSYSLIKPFNICCDFKHLSCGDNGTVLYGTIFNYESVNYFNIENIYYYKNKNVMRENWINKYKYFNDILTKYISQTGYSKNDILFISSLIYKLPKNIISIKDIVPYQIYCLQYLFNNSDKVYYKVELNSNNKKIIKKYTVKCCINHDEYDIFDNDTFISKAYIPDYKTSVYMNNIFRNIRENKNLDLLEESDDEDDFENIYIDKYVDLEKKQLMNLEYDNTFQLWKPVIR
tara:strand:- start:1661 stop:2515 length:855 start_codon:yes stop_codon:yes gene_type:complete